jgi:glycosyltransferase involved in cell wall biosynthesis
MLLSLRLQTESNIEVLVADNSIDESIRGQNVRLCDYSDHVTYLHCGGTSCYRSSTRAAKFAVGEYLCFPSDDGYYVPGFAALMLEAARNNNWDLVYCDVVDDPRQFGRYGVRDVQPALGYIDKTCYIVKREVFMRLGGFPAREGDNDWAADWWLVDDLIKSGVRHGKLDQLLVVHN